MTLGWYLLTMLLVAALAIFASGKYTHTKVSTGAWHNASYIVWIYSTPLVVLAAQAAVSCILQLAGIWYFYA